MHILLDYLAQLDFTFSIFLVTLLYLGAVQLFRFQRAKRLPERFNMKTRVSFSKMTVQEAWIILKELTELEFPYMVELTTLLAIFMPYGIPEVSSLLASTGQLTKPETISKRITDTGVLIHEFVLNPPSSGRSIQAIARMNRLHRRYQRAGKIRDSDMLYTLGLLALEPPHMIAKYEWRAFSDIELCAQGTFWRAIGDAMSIPYDTLSSSKTGWMDGLHWLEEMEEWVLQYRREAVRPAESNARLSHSTIEVLMHNIRSRSIKRIIKLVYSCLLSDQLRHAIDFPEPSAFTRALVLNALAARKFFIRHFCLPRFDLFRRIKINGKYNMSTGHYTTREYNAFPRHVKPTFSQRWSVRAWIAWLAHAKLPADAGGRFRARGYHISEFGPEKSEGKGTYDIQRMNGSSMVAGCPFGMKTA